jgi:hypothetical protein
MTEEQQRIAIAEVCGGIITMPDYPRDLNAMHDAEVYAAANVADFDRFYWIKLAEVTKCSRIDGKQIAHATASERAEAFVKTLNLRAD